MVDIKTESGYFTLNPSKGLFVHHQMVGEAIDPYSLPPQQMKANATTFDQYVIPTSPSTWLYKE